MAAGAFGPKVATPRSSRPGTRHSLIGYAAATKAAQPPPSAHLQEELCCRRQVIASSQKAKQIAETSACRSANAIVARRERKGTGAALAMLRPHLPSAPLPSA